MECSDGIFEGTQDGALLLDGAEIKGNLNLGPGFRAEGSVVLATATISGNLVCQNGRFRGRCAPTTEGRQIRGPALTCDQVTIGGSAFLQSRFSGGVRLLTARISGDVDCRGGTFGGTEAGALFFDGADIKGSVYLTRGFVAKGLVQLSTTAIAGNLDCAGGQFKGWIKKTEDGVRKRQTAMFCDQIKIGGSAFFAQLSGESRKKSRFVATGPVRLTGAKVGGSLVCTGARFAGSFVSQQGRRLRAADLDIALNCEQVEVGGSVFLDRGFFSIGTVSLRGATIGRYLICIGGRFWGNRTGALACDRIKINGNVFLTKPFYAKGAVGFIGADIAGDLNCDGGRFDPQDDNALHLDRATIRGNVHLRFGFIAKGRVGLVGARIGGDLDLRASRMAGPLVCDHAAIENILYFMNVRGPAVRRGVVEPLISRVSLLAATAATLMDDSASWTKVSEAYLDGFRYARIVGDPRMDASGRIVQTTIDAKSRIAWLDRQPARHRKEDFRPQPWEQLIKTLREMGNAEEAKAIAIEKQERLRRAGKISRSARCFHAAFGFFAGYGYRPLRLTGYLLGAWLLCGTFFLLVAKQGVMAPTKLRDADQEKYSACRVEMRGNWTNCPILPYEYTTFSPYIYSLDLILPLVGLQQKTDWAPMVRRPCARSIDLIVADFCIEPAPAAAKVQTAVPQAYWPVGVAAWIVMWIEILLGWIAGILFGAALSVHIKKE